MSEEKEAAGEAEKALPEEAAPSKKAKKPPAPEPEALTDEDLKVLEEGLDDVVDEDERTRVRNVLQKEGIRTILRDQREHLQSVESALLIADRWDPRNRNTERKTVPEENGGVRIIAFPAGNMDSIDELETDAVYLSALNAKISNLLALSKSAVNRAKSNLKIIRAEARKRIAEARRAGHLRGKIKNLDQVEDLADAMKAIRQAEKDILDVEEQSELLTGCYFAVKDLSGTLMERAKGRRREKWEAKGQLN